MFRDEWLVFSWGSKALAAFMVMTGAALAPAAAADWDSAFPVESPYNWSGLYAGIHGGYAWANWNGQLFYEDWESGAAYWEAPFNFSDQSISADGWFGGLQAGANQQYGSLVVGLEADVAWTGIDGSKVLEPYPESAKGPANWQIENKLDVFGTVRGRLGVANDKLLLYGTGGFAWAKVSSNNTTVWPPEKSTNTQAYGEAQNNHTGWAVGAGGELALNPSLSVKLEYLYVNLGEQDYAYVGELLDDSGTVYATDHYRPTLDFHTVQLGVNFHLPPGS